MSIVETILSQPSYTDAVLAMNPASHYPLWDGDAVMRDLVGGYGSGTHSLVTWGTGGIIAPQVGDVVLPAYYYGGTNSQSNVTTAKQLGSVFSISGWVRPTATITINYIVSGRQTAGGGGVIWGAWFANSYSDASFKANSTGFALYASTQILACTDTNSVAGQLNTWHHLVFAYDNSATPKMSIYWNGVNQTLATNTVTGSPVTHDYMRFGQRCDRTDGLLKFPGYLSQFSFWDRKLTAAEAEYLYLAGKHGV